MAGPERGVELPAMSVATSLPRSMFGASESKMAPVCKPSRIHWYLRSVWSWPGAVNS